MKRFILFVCLLALLVPLAACGEGPTPPAPVSYRTDAALADLSDAVEQYLDPASLAPMQESYLKGPMKLDTALFADYVVKINAYGANIDEYGIFKAPDDASVDAVKAAVDGYIQLRKDTWMEEYMPEEKPKLTKAEVRTYGQYVIYVIVADDVRSPILTAFEAALRA